MTDETSEKSAERQRRRHGRFRRWVVRPVFWVVAAVALLMFGAVLVIESSFVRERGRLWLESRLGALLERQVRVESLGLEVLPLALELRGVEVAGSEPGEPAFLEVERLLVEVRSFRWRGRKLSIGRILVEGPVVRLVFHEDGSSNIPLRGRERGAGGGGLDFDLSVGEFTIREGALEVDQQRLPLNVAGRNLRANLLGGAGLEGSGRIDVDEVELLLPSARPYVGSISMRVAVGAEELRIVSGRVSGPSLEAAIGGEWTWRPRRGLDLDLDGRAEGALFDLLGYASGQVSGSFEFDLGLAWRPELWGYRGSLESPRLDVLGRVLTAVSADVAGDRNGVYADVDGAGYGGGRVTGRVGFRHGEEDRPFDLDLALDGVALSRLLVDQAVPLSGVEARVTGPFSYRFPIRDPSRGNGRAQLQLSGGAVVDERLQLTGSVPLTFRDGVLSSEAIQVASESQRFLVSGTYDLSSRAGRFDLEAATDRVSELLGLLPIAPESLEGAAWVPQRGRGEVAVALILSPAGTRSDVRLDLADVECPGARADKLTGAFSVDEAGLRDLRLELVRPNGAVIVSGSVPFSNGVEPALGFSLAVEAAGWPFEDTGAWLPFELPLEGSISGSLLLEGDPSAPLGRLDASLSPARVAGVEIESLDAELDFDSREVRFTKVEAVSAAGNARLGGRFEIDGGELDLSLASDALSLAESPLSDLLPELEPGGSDLTSSGRVEVTGRLTGTTERPRLEGELAWSELTYGARRLSEPARTAVAWNGERVVISGSLPGAGVVDGGGRLDRDGFEIAVELENDDLSDLLTAVTGRAEADLSGALTGAVTVSGSFAGELEPVVALRLDRLDLAQGDLTLETVEPVSMRLAGGVLAIESLYLNTPDLTNEIFVAGRVALAGDRRLDLTAQSTLASEWLELLLPEIDMRAGRFEVLASIGGTLDQPTFNGVGRLAEGSLLIDALAMSVESLDGVFLLYPDRVVIDSVSAVAAGGRVTGGGTIVLPRGDIPVSYQLNALGSGLSLSYPEGWLIRGDALVSLVSTDAGRALRGEITLERAYYLESIKLGFESALQSLFQRRRVLVAETSELKATTALNLSIRGRDALRVRNNVGNLGGDVDFALRGSLAAPVLFGRVTLSPGGTLVYAGNEYEIERGELNFANPYRIDPIIDLQATTDLREYDVRLNLSGSPERLRVGVSSNPPLPELEVLALLTGGRAPTRAGLEGGDGAGEALGVEGFLAGEAASVVTERVNRLFGLDRLRVSPLTGAGGDLSSARVTLGERISRDLFATYSYDPSTTEEQILELEWSVSPRLLVVLTQNGDTSYSVDLRWEKTF